MRIIAIESLHWQVYPRSLYVRVHTDAGIIGLGETVEKTGGSRGALHGTIAPLVLGQNPLDIEGLWRFVFDNIMYHGYAGAELRALSAVEIALWDILGQQVNAPLYQLLGGKVREAVPTYNTCISFGDVQDYQQWHEDAGQLARSLLGEGIRAMKIWPFDAYSEATHGHYIHPDDIENGLRPVRQIREAVGTKMEIGIECHFRWSRASAERIVAALQPYNILFVEDPLAPTYPDEIRALSQKTTIPIVGSEMLMTRWQVREWLEKHVSQILMTDALWNGGVGETCKIAAMAEAFGVPLVLHNLAGPVAQMVNLHLGLHISNLMFMESSRALYRTHYDVISDYQPEMRGGHFLINDRPGIGVTLRQEMFERDDLSRQVSEGAGMAVGKRAMGDHWQDERIR
jgi:L-alanine-DL-glutamate epimerase-like enolase superfamily enzyme